jgi:Rrf2 family protein
MLSKKSKYAIKALMSLAKRYEEKTPLKISIISEEQHIPRKFLEAILVELRNNGLLYSRMGAGGGYLLAKHPNELFLSHVIRISGGPIAMLPCVSLNFYEPCEECEQEQTCSLNAVMKEVREATIAILSKTSIADMIAKEKQLKKSLRLDD